MPHRTPEELREEISSLEKQLRLERGQKSNDRFLAGALETVPVGVVTTDLEGRIIHGNRWVEEMVRHPVLHSDDAESYGEWISFHEDGSRVESHEYPLSRVIRDGEDYSELDVHYQRGDGSRFWMRIIGRPILNEEGERIGASVALIDIDDERQLEQQQAILIAELDHRVKNAFTVMKAITRHALRSADIDEALERELNARFEAYAQAHAMLGTSNLDAMSLAEIAADSTAYFGDERISICGTHVMLPSRAALALSMAFYELGTNAFKHGALLNPEGTVSLEWAFKGRDGNQQLELLWQEAGGPPVIKPERAGFGTFVITKAVAAATDGQVSMEFEEGGLSWSLVMQVGERNE